MYKILKKILFILPRKDLVKLLLLFLMMMVGAILEVTGIGMIPAFVSVVASPEKVLEYESIQPLLSILGITDSKSLLIWGSGILVTVFLIKSLYAIAFNYIEARYIFNRQYFLQKRLMIAYMFSPYIFHLQRNSAELLRNVNTECNLIINSVLANLLKLSREGVMALSILVFLIIIEPLITLLVCLISGAGAGIFIYFTQEKVKDYGVQEQNHRRNMIKAFNQGIGGIKDSKILNREFEFIEKFRIEALKSSRLKRFMRYIKQIPRPVVETSAVIGMMMIATLLVLQGRPMSAIIPILTLFAMATVRFMPAVQQITSMYTDLRYNIVSLSPIYNDLRTLEPLSKKLQISRGEKTKLELKNYIRSENIHYRYPGSEEYALKGVSFTVPKGNAVAFVGESGAGKTTIVDLLLGLLEPTHGMISVDGTNIHSKLSAWQLGVGYIPQTIYLADETLRSNIAFGVPESEIDDEQVKNAIALAQLDNLLEMLPMGLDTVMGENGTRLSGGQRQRVGIARALYHNPQVLVMDEATSALDNITEKRITEAIGNLKGERTIIMIAHRLTTVENCDLLYLMKDGQIIDSGTYPEMIEGNKEFRKMALMK